MLSIIVTWRNRNELAGALAGLVETAGRLNGEVVIVNFGGDAASLARQLEGFEHAVQVAQWREQRYFHKTKAQNLGAHAARHDMLSFATATSSSSRTRSCRSCASSTRRPACSRH